MPARQRRAVLDDVAGGPQDAAFVERARHIVVGAEDVEIAGLEPLDHEIDGLLRGPGAGRLLGAAARSQTGEDEARDQQMRRQLAAVGVAQLVLQRLGERLHAGLGDVVGGIARRRGDALLGAGVDDQPRPAALDHVGHEGLGAVDHAPQVDAEDALPIVRGSEHRAAGLDAGIVHQDVGAAEPFRDAGFELRNRVRAADVDRRRHDVGRAARRRR